MDFPSEELLHFLLMTESFLPGGVGFDINCGVRLLSTPLQYKDVTGRRDLIDELFRTSSHGGGCKGFTESLCTGA